MQFAKTVFMCSGQGSQYFNMGRTLYEKERVFRRWMDYADAIVRESTGCSALTVLYDVDRPRKEAFDHTLVSHPTIVMIQYAMGRTLLEAGVKPSIALGASLGTFAAAAITGCLTIDQALTASVAHAQMLNKCCERGVMFAILAPLVLYDRARLEHHCEIAAINFENHFVVSACAAQAVNVESRLRGAGVAFQRLPVQFAFHSRWIDGAKVPFQTYLRTVRSEAALIPLACCAQAKCLNSVPQGHLWDVTRDPVRFQQTIEHLESSGPYHYVDIGPSGTLATFVRNMLPRTSASTVHATLSPYGRDSENLEAVASQLGRY